MNATAVMRAHDGGDEPTMDAAEDEHHSGVVAGRANRRDVPVDSATPW
ncbi:MAG: hypothetical protein JO181_05435 [Solirubrobacterales bacterium]|nr:hypothetical protein [Solirubrobacterales bacterium]